MFGDLAPILSSVGIAPSTYATYAADWKTWVEWRQTVVRKGAYVDKSQGAEAVAVEIAKFMAYLFFCLLYTSPSPRDGLLSRMPSSA